MATWFAGQINENIFFSIWLCVRDELMNEIRKSQALIQYPPPHYGIAETLNFHLR